MKIALFNLLIVLTSYYSFAQEKKIWFDKNWKESKEELASYYRLYTKEKQDKSTLYQVRDFYLDGTLQMSGAFLDRKMKVHEGPFVFYRSDGSVSKKCSYNNGLLNGVYSQYSEDGDLILESSYLDGKRHGTETMYQSGARLFKKGNYENGKAVGHHFTYYKTGELQDDELYDGGVLQGISSFYYQNGKLSSVEIYDNGSLTSYKMYNEDGSDAPETDILEQKPEFPGGVEAMKNYISNEIEYPKFAIEQGIEGKVFISFTVMANGEIGKVKINKDMLDCLECGKEAERVIESMPHWTPSISHHRNQDYRFAMPITFKLESANRVKKRH